MKNLELKKEKDRKPLPQGAAHTRWFTTESARTASPPQGKVKGGPLNGTKLPRKPISRYTSIARVGVKEIQKVNILRINEILSEYQVQFKAKQQIKEFYGGLSENSFQQIKGSNKINILEKRLDVLIFRFGFARSVQEARVLIKGGLVQLNNNLVNRKAYKKIVSIGSRITVLSTDLAYLAKIKQLKYNLEPQPTHLIVSIKDQLSGYLIKEPTESELYLPYKFPISKI